MGLKTFKAYTPSTRQKSQIDFSELLTNNVRKKGKKLIQGFHRAQGRNNQGKITIHHKGGGHKRRYRLIDFKRNKYNVTGKVEAIQYDPNRNTNIALINYEDGQRRYILHPETLKKGDKISSGGKSRLAIGNALALKNIPLGIDIHNIELYPGKGGQFIRTAGNAGQILAKEKNYVAIRLSSKEIRLFPAKCFATIGRLGNADIANVNLGKAGRKRWLGIRPTVRGAAMNPVDHPHGGGEGRCPIGKAQPLTPWGKAALGLKTRKKSLKSNMFIIRSRKGK